MPLIYITGPTGAGKSSLTELLIKEGFEAHDADIDICKWYNRDSGKLAEYPKDPNLRPPGWQESHQFLMSEDLIKTIKSRSDNKTIFILGQSPNDIEMADKYFDKVLCLTIDESTMLKRLKKRTNNIYGKSPDQLEIIKKWYQPTIDRYRNYGATMIDASRPIESVRDAIIDNSELNPTALH